MFITLLFSTFAASALITFIVILLFRRPIKGILNRLIGEPSSEQWCWFLYFALFVWGISSGVKLSQLERYWMKTDPNTIVPALTSTAWVVELYRALQSTLEGLASGLMTIFVVGLLAFIVVKGFESRGSTRGAGTMPEV